MAAKLFYIKKIKNKKMTAWEPANSIWFNTKFKCLTRQADMRKPVTGSHQ